MTVLLILIPPGDADEPMWVHIEDGQAVARGHGWTGHPDAKETVGETVAVVPGDAVVLHWIELPRLSQPQAAAAARMMAADVSAAPVSTLHVALGREEADGVRVLALVERARMAAWMARLQDAGISPDRVVPAQLLVEAPDHGIRMLADGPWRLGRGPRTGFAVEADLAALLTEGQEVEQLTAAAFEAGLPAALDKCPLDLRQGDFAPRRSWTTELGAMRRTGWLAAALIAMTLIGQAAIWIRHDIAADRLGRDMAVEMRRVLPDASADADPVAALTAELAARQGGRFAPTMAAINSAVQASPGVELMSLDYQSNGNLRLTARAPQAATLEALANRLRGGGGNVSLGTIRTMGDRQEAELMVQPS